MTTSMTIAQKALRTFHGPRMQKSIPDKNFFVRTVKDRSEDIQFGGRDFIMYAPIQTQKNWGVGTHAPGGDFASSEDHAFTEWAVPLAHNNFNLSFDGEFKDSSENRPDLSYLGNALQFETKSLMDTIKSWMGSIVFGDGTGALAQCDTGAGAITATQFYVDNPGVQWLERGMKIIAIDPANKASGGTDQLGGAETITAIDRENNRVTISSTTGLANDDYIFLENCYGSTQANGLLGIVDDGSVDAVFQGITRSGAEYAQGQVITTTNPLTEAEITGVFRRLKNFGYSEKCDHIITDTLSVEWLFNSMIDRQRFSGSELVGGYSAVKYETPFGTKTIVDDPKAWPGYMYFLDLGTFFCGWGNKKGGDWYQPNGNIVLPRQAASGTGYADAYLATWICRWQFGCTDPYSNAVLQGYTST